MPHRLSTPALSHTLPTLLVLAAVALALITLASPAH